MTWDQFTDVLPVLTLILGYAGSQVTDQLRECHERERIVLQRAADVEGEALLELQDLLIGLPEAWIQHLTRWETWYERGDLDPGDAYDAAHSVGRPWQRAILLSSRIMDDDVRTTVAAAIDIAYPFDAHNISAMFGGLPHDDFPYQCEKRK